MNGKTAKLINGILGHQKKLKLRWRLLSQLGRRRLRKDMKAQRQKFISDRAEARRIEELTASAP